MIYLAIDPGSRALGWALLDPTPTADPPVQCGALLARLSLSPAEEADALLRLLALRARLDWLVMVLGLPHGKRVTLVLEHLVGRRVHPNPTLDFWIQCLRQWGERHKWRVQVYPPDKWRESVQERGAGRPTKETVKFWVLQQYPQFQAVADGPGGMDALEALGLALYARDVTKFELAAEAAR